MKIQLLPTILAGTAYAGALSSTWLAWPANATGISYETVTLTAVTTYCPAATVLTHGGFEYTVTAETTLTITDCPCTITRPIQSLTPTTILYTSCPPTGSPAPANPNNGANNGGAVTVTNSAGQVVTVTNVVQTAPANTAVAGGAAATGGGVAPNNGTVFTGEGIRVGAGVSLVLGLAGVLLVL